MGIGDLRSPSGQASSEYVGAVAVVALLLITAAAVTGPASIGPKVLSAMRHAVCTVGGGICSSAEARHAGLDPCVVALRRDERRVGGAIAVVRLRRGDELLVERRSDGTAAVSFSDRNHVGAGTGVGLKLGRLGLDAEPASVAGGVSFNTGRSHEFTDWRTAEKFIASYAAEESTGGEAVNLARGISPLHQRHRLPAPRMVAYEAGGWAEVDADLGLHAGDGMTKDVDGGVAAQSAALLGRRRSGKSTTYYMSLDRSISAHLGAVIGAVGNGRSQGTVLELTIEGDKPVRATLTNTVSVSEDFGLYGQATDLRALSDSLRGASLRGAASASGRSLETRVSLDLDQPEDGAAVSAVVDAIRGRASPGEWAARGRALGQRLDQAGDVDLAILATRTSRSDLSVEVALGGKVGVENVRTRTSSDLVAAWSIKGGRDLRAREDCSPAMVT